MLFILFVTYSFFLGTPYEYQNTVVVNTEFPLTTLEACTTKAEALAIDSMIKNPVLAPYKTYQCLKESI